MTGQTRIDLEMTVRRSPRVGGVTIDTDGEYVDPAPWPKTPFIHKWADIQWKVLKESIKALIALAIVAMFALMIIFWKGVLGL